MDAQAITSWPLQPAAWDRSLPKVCFGEAGVQEGTQEWGRRKSEDYSQPKAGKSGLRQDDRVRAGGVGRQGKDRLRLGHGVRKKEK